MSGRVNIIQPKKIFDNADMSATLTSEEIFMEHVGGFSIDMEWTTSDIAGAFEIQVSNGLTWHTIPESQLNIQGNLSVASADGTGFVNVVDHQGYKFRIVFTPTSGATGTVNAIIGGKAL